MLCSELVRSPKRPGLGRHPAAAAKSVSRLAQHTDFLAFLGTPGSHKFAWSGQALPASALLFLTASLCASFLGSCSQCLPA